MDVCLLQINIEMGMSSFWRNFVTGYNESCHFTISGVASEERLTKIIILQCVRTVTHCVPQIDMGRNKAQARAILSHRFE